MGKQEDSQLAIKGQNEFNELMSTGVCVRSPIFSRSVSALLTLEDERSQSTYSLPLHPESASERSAGPSVRWAPTRCANVGPPIWIPLRLQNTYVTADRLCPSEILGYAGETGTLRGPLEAVSFEW